MQTASSNTDWVEAILELQQVFSAEERVESVSLVSFYCLQNDKVERVNEV